MKRTAFAIGWSFLFLIVPIGLAAPGWAQTVTVREALQHFDGGTRPEGDFVSFEVVSDTLVSTALEVRLRISESGNMITGEGVHTLMIPAGRDLVSHDVTSQDDTTGEPDSRVRASILSGSGYRVGTPGSTSILLTDNDEGSVEVSVRASSSSIAEGQSAHFRITRTGSTQAPLTLSVEIEASHGVLSSPQQTEQVTFGAGQRTRTLSYRTLDAEGGRVDATLLHGSHGATITNGYASVEVRNASYTPTVKLQRAADTISEGSHAQFIVERDRAIAEPLDVILDVRPNRSDVIAGTFTRRNTVTIPAWARTALFDLRTVEDDIVPDGTITGILLASSAYRVGSPGRKTITVQSDDASVVRLTRSSTAMTVTEGTSLDFRIERAVAEAHALRVPLEIRQDGDFLDASALALREVTIPARSRYRSFRIGTVNDTTNEAHGSVTVAIGYNASDQLFDQDPTADSITVAIADNDVASVQFSSKYSGVRYSEGDTISDIYIRRDNPEHGDLPAITVRVQVEQEGSMFTSRTRTMLVPLAENQIGAYVSDCRPGTNSTTGMPETQCTDYRVPYDDRDQMDGSIRFRIMQVGGYRKGETGETDWLAITDDDIEILTLTGPRPPAGQTMPEIREGSSASFTLTRTNAQRPLRALVWVERQNGWPGEGSGAEEIPITFSRTARTARFRVSIPNDSHDLSDGFMNVSLVTDSVTANQTDPYEVSGETTVRVRVRDNDTVDRPPRLSVTALTRSVLEGTDAKFRLRRTGSTTIPLFARFTHEVQKPQSTDVWHTDRQVTFPAGRSSVDVTVPTYVDSFVENRFVAVQLDDVFAYQWGVGNGKQSPQFVVDTNRARATATVRNNANADFSTVSIVNTGPSSIIEGETERVTNQGVPSNVGSVTRHKQIKYKLTRTGTAENIATRIKVSVKLTSYKGSYIKGGNKTVQVDIPPDAREASFTVDLEDNDRAESVAGDGGVELEVLNVGDYLVSSQNKFRVTVVDNDPYFLLSATSQDLEVVEGSSVSITATLMRGDPAKSYAIHWNTSDGTTPVATPGDDYTAIVGSTATNPRQVVIFAPGETVKTFEVATVTDDVDDGGEKFKVEFVSDSGTIDTHETANFQYTGRTTFVTGSTTIEVTITNDGPLPGKWVAEFSHDAGTRTVDAILDQLDRGGTGPRVWTQVVSAHIDGSNINARNKGAIVGYQEGTDRTTIGVAFSSFAAEGRLADHKLTGEVSGIYPYIEHSLHETISVWAVAGRGYGDIGLSRSDIVDDEASLEMSVAAVGSRVAAYRDETAEVGVNTDAAWIEAESGNAGDFRSAKTNSFRYRTGIEATYRLTDRVAAAAGMGYEQSGGDIEGNEGARGTVGISYADEHLHFGLKTTIAEDYEPELTIGYRDEDWQARMVMSGTDKLNLTGSFSYDMGKDRRGLILGMNQQWRENAEQVEIRVGYGVFIDRNEVAQPYLAWTQEKQTLGIEYDIGPVVAVFSMDTSNFYWFGLSRRF